MWSRAGGPVCIRIYAVVAGVRVGSSGLSGCWSLIGALVGWLNCALCECCVNVVGGVVSVAGHQAVAEVLLQNGAKRGFAASMRAYWGRAKRFCVAFGVLVLNYMREAGVHTEMVFVLPGHLAVAQVHLQARADIGAQTTKGETALVIASGKGM